MSYRFMLPPLPTRKPFEKTTQRLPLCELLAVLVSALLLAVGFASPVLAAAGDPNASSDSGGGVTTTLGGPSPVTISSNDSAHALALQADGKIVVAGSSDGAGKDDFALARYNPDGSLDASFGTGGKVTTGIGTDWAEARALALQADGKIVLAGWSHDGRGLNESFVLTRYNPNGSLDASFGTGGRVTTHIGGVQAAHALALQADGKIVVTGIAYPISGHDIGFALVRYNSDGSLDTSFGTGGTMATTIGTSDAAAALVLQADGKIVVAGSSSNNNGTESDFALARYNPDGSLDTSFGTGGTVTTTIGTHDAAHSLALQADGKIVVAGSSDGRFALARYNPDGSLDSRFGTDGKATAIIGTDEVFEEVARALALQADGKIVVVGYTSNGVPESRFAVARYNADGTLDVNFGSGGKVVITVGGNDQASALAIHTDGKIVVAGTSYDINDFNFALARYHPDGSLDASFGMGGKVTTNFTTSTDADRCETIVPPFRGLPGGRREAVWSLSNMATALALQTDSKIVVAGRADNTFAMARYNTDGSLDTSFGMGGTVISDIATGEYAALTLQADSKVVVAGYTSNGVPESRFAVARYNADGTLDVNFGSSGKVITNFNVSSDIFNALALQPDGKIVVAGCCSDSGSLALARYNLDGNLDTSFGTGGMATTSFSTGDFDREANILAIQADGKIVVAGDFAVARYNPDGSLDTSFGTGGTVTTRIDGVLVARALALQADGKIVVAGRAKKGFAVVRYNPDGSLDASLGSGGTVTTTIGTLDAAHSLALQADGKIVVAGRAEKGFAVVRYNPDGSLDTGFGTGDKETTSVGADSDYARALAFQQDGKIIVVGACANARHTNFAVVRYNPDGSLDTTFDTDGKVTTRIGSGSVSW